MPLFTVVIPLFNKEKYIYNTLLSVLNQDFDDFEIIVINDASTDNSLEIAKQFSDSRIYILENKKNLGLSATRNIGIEKATGTIITLLDADDVWMENFLSTIHSLYKKFPSIKIYASDYTEKHSESLYLEPKKNIPESFRNKSFIIDDFFIASIGQPISCSNTFAFKKEVFNDIGGFDEKITFSEDLDYYIRSCLKYQMAYSYTSCCIVTINSQNQITKAGIKNKNILNFKKFTAYENNNISLKRYLDFQRYVYCIEYKVIGDKINYKKLKKNIDFSNLSSRQQFLINCPSIFLKTIKFVKLLFLKTGIRITSF